MALWEYLWAWSSVTKWLYHLNGNANDSSGNWNNATSSSIVYVDWKIWSKCAWSTSKTYITLPSTFMWTIWTWDFAISFWLNPVNPWTWQYPMLFWSFKDSSPYVWPTIFYDPLNIQRLWDCCIFRVTRSNEQCVSWASSLYWEWVNVVFTRISWVCYVYYNWELKLQFNDTTYIPTWESAYIFSRNGHYQQFCNTWAKFDECIVETGVWWTAEKVKKQYTYAKWRFWVQ